ncbi:DUF2283 domain-containing protein [Ochrobactrum anthropi ATCC 49188]|nr:DUF2283 domain-containing protein [Brucella anthropi ATCC 49188]
MKISYDDSVDAAYINLNDEFSPTLVDYTYCCDPNLVDGQIHLDFDNDGRLVGIEILQASKTPFIVINEK